MKKRLKKWVKVVITVLVGVAGIMLWKQAGTVGELAQTSTTYFILCLLLWFYLLVGQILILKLLWEK